MCNNYLSILSGKINFISAIEIYKLLLRIHQDHVKVLSKTTLGFKECASNNPESLYSQYLLGSLCRARVNNNGV